MGGLGLVHGPWVESGGGLITVFCHYGQSLRSLEPGRKYPIRLSKPLTCTVPLLSAANGTSCTPFIIVDELKGSGLVPSKHGFGFGYGFELTITNLVL